MARLIRSELPLGDDPFKVVLASRLKQRATATDDVIVIHQARSTVGIIAFSRRFRAVSGNPRRSSPFSDSRSNAK
jgi:hypothetical protein